MENLSILASLGLPPDFGKVLLVLVLALLLAPYLAGADFGVVKIPAFADATRQRLKVLGPLMFVIVLLLHVPIVPSKKTSGSLSGRWCGAFDEKDLSEVMDITQTGTLLSGTAFFADRFGNVRDGRSMVQGTVARGGQVTFTLIRDSGQERYTLVGSSDAAVGSMQVSFGGTGPPTYYTRPCPGL